MTFPDALGFQLIDEIALPSSRNAKNQDDSITREEIF